MWRVLILVVGLVPTQVLAQSAPEPEGYRDAPYKGEVPAGLTGATTVDTDEAHRLWEEGQVIFIDAMPRDVRPPDLPEGTIWRDRPRDSIPGAVWLPNVGYSKLPPEDEAYFRAGLATVTESDPSRPILFFCMEDCWMSWNAAKRATEMGYRSVYWYPGGTDGWAGAGHATEPVEPLDPT
ncbi:PQQ-dependent catabolism-associated CXXCW motif protein [Rubellimicrobium rubrum]|uniref:PQQ-dependent catabolism-associated CXXCW motif protein n=1 Tax=Rubellimicrobium rubrum TaxID=2585369 RepID=A0A5C4MNS2_9RHOB|nr:PQQ-dependent catabolism-associated CXXCW motif protein [Rubellimicrobium rubrum]TNC46945.1 PQQ-dependent catabolism-associated CXXCW motif protein [Rubellimicrobium rubrum]